MSKYKLPSSQCLIAFEAAARLKSFSSAATELCLTPPAITNKIKQLEEYLGWQLFIRQPKGVILSDAGKDFYYDVEKTLNHLQNSLEKYKNSDDCLSVTVSVTPTFANRYLVQRLKYFWLQHPAIELNIHRHLDNKASILSEQVDIAVFWSDGNWQGLVAEPLLSGEKTPIISPELAKKINLQSPADLQRTTLLHEEDHNDWKQWLEIAGISYNDCLGPIIDDAEALLSLTIAGQGVSLGRVSMLAQEIASKQLICPFPLQLPSTNDYWLVYNPIQKNNPAVMCFRDFLLEQVNAAS